MNRRRIMDRMPITTTLRYADTRSREARAQLARLPRWRWWLAPNHFDDANKMGPTARDRVSEIEDAVASGAMNAMQCFTQMRQLIVKLDHSAGVWVVVDAATVERVAAAIYDLMPYDGLQGTQKPKWQDGGNSNKQYEAREKARAALAQPADADAEGGE